MIISDLQPGDVLLYQPNPKASWIAKAIAMIQWFIREGFGANSHVTVVSEDFMFCCESTWPKSRLFLVGGTKGVDFKHYVIKVHRPKASAEQIGKILEWCDNHLGIWYDVLRIITLAKWGIPGLYVCSTFVGAAFASVGLVLKENSGHTLSPNEIEQSDKLEFVGYLEDLVMGK